MGCNSFDKITERLDQQQTPFNTNGLNKYHVISTIMTQRTNKYGMEKRNILDQ